MQILCGEILARHRNFGLRTATFTYKNRNNDWQDEDMEKKEEHNEEDWKK